MKRSAFLCLALLTACGGSVAAEPLDDCPTLPDDAGAPEAAPPVTVPEASTPDIPDAGRVSPLECPMTVDTLSPQWVPVPGGGLITATGCGFLGLKEVRVYWVPVPFQVLDDRHLVFYSGQAPAGATSASAEVWFIRDKRQVMRYFGFKN